MTNNSNETDVDQVNYDMMDKKRKYISMRYGFVKTKIWLKM